MVNKVTVPQSALDAIDSSKGSKALFYMVAVVAVGAFADFYAFVSYNAASTGIIKNFHISGVLFSETVLAFSIGAVIGAIAWGYITDIFGRRRALVIDLIMMIVFIVGQAFSKNFTELFVFRLLVGLAIGGDFPASISLLTEFSPKAKRGSLISLFWIFLPFGGFVAWLMGYGLYLSLGFSLLEYKVLILTGIIPPLVGLVVRLKVPESPRWLLRNGKINEAVEIVRKNIDPNFTIDISSYQNMPAEAKNIKKSRVIIPLILLISIAAFLTNLLAGSEVGVSSIIYSAFGIVGVKTDLYTAITVNLAFMIGATITYFVIQRLGRFKTALIGGIISVIFDVSILGVTKYPDALLAFILITNISINMFIPVVTVWSSEIFETSLRGKSIGFQAVGNRLSTGVGSYITASLLSVGALSAVFTVYPALILVAIILGYIVYRMKGDLTNKTLYEASRT
ncbi:MAG: MFS transporter [Thermoplasmataceae archaeon]|jgi:putative MFS transporter